MIKENELEIETKDKKYFVKLGPGPSRPLIICKDKESHRYERVDHPAVHYVVSETDKTKTYMVIEHPQGWICTCKSWQFHGECKHVLSAKGSSFYCPGYVQKEL